MGRLRREFVERVEALAHRVLDVADKLESLGKSGRVIEQITSAGTAGMDQARTARWART
jgi:hypothetical protein